MALTGAGVTRVILFYSFVQEKAWIDIEVDFSEFFYIGFAFLRFGVGHLTKNLKFLFYCLGQGLPRLLVYGVSGERIL